MSKNKKNKSKKVVRFSEDHLVKIMNDIVTEAVEKEKEKWLAEQESKKEDKVAMLESKLAKLQNKVEALTESK